MSSNPFEQDDEAEAAALDESNPFYEPRPVAQPPHVVNKDDKREGRSGSGKVQGTGSSKTAAGAAAAEAAGHPFQGLISRCFEPYLHIYIESQDLSLRQLVDRAAQEQRERGTSNLAFEGSSVLHSCGDLFMFYKRCMVQCAQLSTAEPMLALQMIFRKHLREYATKILISNMPGKQSVVGSGGGGATAAASPAAPAGSAIAAVSSAALAQNAIASSVSSLTRELKDFSTQGLLQNFQSFMKEGEPVKITPDEWVFLCSIIVTSEYIIGELYIVI